MIKEVAQRLKVAADRFKWCKVCYNGNAQEHQDAYEAVLDAISLLEKQEEMVEIEPIAEFLSEYAAPPQSLGFLISKEDAKKAWIEFMKGF